MGNIEFTSKLPLGKETSLHENLLTPKISLRLNPNDMKNYFTADKKINVGNIVYNNRLGISDSIESGRSLTLGIEYRKEKIEDIVVITEGPWAGKTLTITLNVMEEEE